MTPATQDQLKPSPITTATDVCDRDIGWVEKNTAILVIHGIGHQKSFETLDQFATGLVKGFGAYKDHKLDPPQIEVGHRLYKSPTIEDKVPWYANCLRLTHPYHAHYIDIHEYFWAHETEGTCEIADIRQWVEQVAENSREAYETRFHGGGLQPEESPNRPAENSLFFYTKGGRTQFRHHVYKFVVSTIGSIIPRIEVIAKGLAKLFRCVPFVGAPIVASVEGRIEKQMPSLLNLIGDLVVYNTHDAKSRFYGVRWKIKNKCFLLLQSLLEAREEEKWAYDRVVVVGHSLGSQIGYELLNRLNLLICKGDLKQRFTPEGNELLPRKDGTDRKPTGETAATVVSDLITFGSPLDKVAFFLREWSGEFKIRRQIIDHYLCFKAKPGQYDEHRIPVEREKGLESRLDQVRWTNYHDRNDFVSGHLDFYGELENVDCEFYPRKPNSRNRWLLVLRVLANPWLGGILRALGLALALLITIRLAGKVWRYFGIEPLFQHQDKVAGWFDWLWHFLHLPSLTAVLLIAVIVVVLLGARLMWALKKFTHSRYWKSYPENHMFVDLICRNLIPSLPRNDSTRSRGQATTP